MNILEQFKATAKNPNGFALERLEGVDYFSASRVIKMNKSPGHFKLRYIDGVIPETTVDQAFGKLIHLALVERDEFRRRLGAKRSTCSTESSTGNASSRS